MEKHTILWMCVSVSITCKTEVQYSTKTHGTNSFWAYYVKDLLLLFNSKNSRDDKFCLLLHYNCYPFPFLHFPIFIHFDTKYKYHRNVEWDSVIELHRTRLHIMFNMFHHHGMANPKVVNGTDSLHTGGGWRRGRRSCEYIKQAVTDRWQGAVVQHWGWAENNTLPQKYSVEIL